MFLTLALSLSPALAAGFGDTAGHWGAAPVERWVDAGVLSGDGAGSFLPDKEMTRAEFAQMLCNLMGYTEKAPNTFADVPGDAWYADAILKLNAAGVMSGVGGNLAAPNDPITREQAAVLLCNALNIRPSRGAGIGFSDAGSVSGWAREAVAALTERGMISGVGGNTFAPGVNINRASVAAMVDNIVAEYVTQPGAVITGEVKGVVIVKAGGVTFQDAALSEPLIVAPGAPSASVTLTGSTTAAEVVVAAQGAKLTVDKSAAVDTVAVEAPRASVTVAGKVDAVTVAGSASNATVTARAGATVSSVETSAAGTTVTGSGKVEHVTANAGATRTEVMTNGTKVENNSSSAVTTGSGTVSAGKTDTTTSTGSSSSDSSSGGSSSGGNTGGNQGGTTTPENPNPPKPEDPKPETPKDPTVEKPGTGENAEDKREEVKGQEGTKTEAQVPASDTIKEEDVTGEAAEACADGHIWGDATTTKAATCEETGTAEYSCTVDGCSAKATVEIPALGHTDEANSKVTVTKQPTCTEEGEKTVVCANCGGNSKTVKIEKRAHEYKTGRYDTSDAQHWQLCDYCGTPSETKANHTWTKDDKQSTAATCITKGTTVSTCTCGAKKTEEIAATGKHAAAADAEWAHDLAADTHYKACATEGCTARVDEEAHQWNAQTSKCTVCQYDCPAKSFHNLILTTATCGICGAPGTKEPEAETYTVTVATMTNGTVTSDKGSGGANAGDTVILTVTPSNGYRLKADTLKVTKADGSTVTVTDNKFTMPAADVTVTAEFEQITYKVTIGTVTGGTVTANPTSAVMETNVTLAFAPADGYMVVDSSTIKVMNGTEEVEFVLDEMIGATGYYSFTMPAGNVTVTATFVADSTGG